MSSKYSFGEASGPTYEFKDSYEFKDATAPLNDRRKPRGRGGGYGGGGGDDDGTGSLTYSAASSITGESTDSSFGGILRVLDGQSDGNELASYLKRNGHRGDERSCAADSLAYSAKSATSDSLAYSADAESYMRLLAADCAASHASQLQGSALLSAGCVPGTAIFVSQTIAIACIQLTYSSCLLDCLLLDHSVKIVPNLAKTVVGIMRPLLELRTLTMEAVSATMSVTMAIYS